MHSVKSRLFTLFFLALLPSAALADEAAPQEKVQSRELLVRRVADMTLATLQDQKKSFAAREESLQRGISNMVDIPWIARFVLGNAWRGANDEQRARYTELYGKYLIKMYISNFAQSSERKVSDMKILGIANPKEDTFVARTEVLLSTSEHLRVNYLISDREKPNKIIDVIIEEVSLLATHRAEFAQMASNGGVTKVIATLEKLLSAEKPPMSLAARE